ncbi:MAG: ABC transporter substrate-binding protein [Eubacteriales bacterium]|nr:ABC transporter substrate-binding protein [Eubacteriales bacterium]
MQSLHIKRWKRWTVLLLAVVMTVCSVGCSKKNNEETESGEELPVISDTMGEALTGAYTADKVFSLYVNPDTSLNPITVKSRENLLVCGLVYDTLFEVDETFSVSSRLVKEWENLDDGTTWIFKMDTTVPFHDGSTFTAYDAAYSINRARQTGYYRGRLDVVYGVSALDSETLMISLQYPDTQFPARLIIPVIKKDTINDAYSPGSGPYMFTEEMDRIVLFPEHPDAEEMPLDVIYLKDFSDPGMVLAAFEDSLVDLVTNEPLGLNNLGFAGVNEVRYYTTSSMHYLGFNSESFLFCYPECRYALGFALDRAAIVSGAMGGCAEAAPLPVCPTSALYDDVLSEALSYRPEQSLREFAAAGVADHDDDGKMEYMLTGIPMEIEILFVVCNESTSKVEAAQRITEEMQSMGFNVTLRSMNWDDYVEALDEGEYDMYYGEVLLTADFDLTALVCTDGSMNYSEFSYSDCDQAVETYLMADEDTRAAACRDMCETLARYAVIQPICFEKHQVITHRGVVAGLTPNQYNVFRNFKDWTIDLG